MPIILQSFMVVCFIYGFCFSLSFAPCIYIRICIRTLKVAAKIVKKNDICKCICQILQIICILSQKKDKNSSDSSPLLSKMHLLDDQKFLINLLGEKDLLHTCFLFGFYRLHRERSTRIVDFFAICLATAIASF